MYALNFNVDPRGLDRGGKVWPTGAAVAMRRLRTALFGATALALCAAPAAAGILFSGTATSSGPITVTDIANGANFNPFNGLYNVQIHGGCSGCLTLTLPGAVATPGFGISVVSSPFNYISPSPADGTQSAIPVAGGVDFEHYGGYGDVLMGSAGQLTALLGGSNNFNGFSVWAAPGGSTATLEFDLDQFATSNLITLPTNTPLYLDITGQTAAPITLADLTPGQTPDFQTFAAPYSVDFTVTLTDTPYAPTAAGTGTGTGGTPGGVPEPTTWALLLCGAGLAGGLLRRARSRSPARPGFAATSNVRRIEAPGSAPTAWLG